MGTLLFQQLFSPIFTLIILCILIYFIGFRDKKNYKVEKKDELLSYKYNSKRRPIMLSPINKQYKHGQAYKIGKAFEDKVYKMLRDNGYQFICRDIILNRQVDIVVITSAGIIILECKCWDGIIFGDKAWKHWFQIKSFRPLSESISDGIEIFCEKNPVIQVSEQETCIRQIVGSSTQIKKIVVFENCGQLFLFDNYQSIQTKECEVIQFEDLLDSVKNFKPKSKYTVLSSVEINEFYRSIGHHIRKMYQ